VLVCLSIWLHFMRGIKQWESYWNISQERCNHIYGPHTANSTHKEEQVSKQMY